MFVYKVCERTVFNQSFLIYRSSGPINRQKITKTYCKINSL